MAGALGVAIAVCAKDARATDVTEVAARVETEWKRAGATIERGPARFLYDDERMTVVLTPSGDAGCVTVAMIGARGLSFHAKVSSAEDDPLLEDAGTRASSVAGVLQMERCGEGPPLDHLIVQSDAGRGAIETVVARSAQQLPSLRTLLPERTGGVLPPAPDAGPMPALPPPAKRADLAEARVKRDGGVLAARETWNAGNDGGGEASVQLEPGCHRVELFAPEPAARARSSRRMRLDVDAELRDEDDELLARDRTDAADPRLEACVGEATSATVVFAGAPAGAAVIATHVQWAMPEHLPASWSAEARGRAARALRARHLASPKEEAVALFQGPAAREAPIPMAVDVEPGGCYVAVAVVTQGNARGLGVRAVVGARDYVDERSADDDAGAVAFCAGTHAHAVLEMDSRGIGHIWGLALYRTQSGMWEGAR